MKFDFSYFLSVFPEILPYVPTTIFISLTSMGFAVTIGLIIALIREGKIPLVDPLLALYISIFRGIPTVVLLFIIYYGLAQIFPIFKLVPAIVAAILCFSLKFAAYLAEIFRAGLQSVDFGQKEASLSVGLTTFQSYRRIILPQAFINALPGVGNMFISLIKDSSVAFFVGVAELLAAGKLLATNNYKFLETYLAVGLTYWVIVVLYSWFQKWLEAKLQSPYRRG